MTDLTPKKSSGSGLGKCIAVCCCCLVICGAAVFGVVAGVIALLKDAYDYNPLYARINVDDKEWGIGMDLHYETK